MTVQIELDLGREPCNITAGCSATIAQGMRCSCRFIMGALITQAMPVVQVLIVQLGGDIFSTRPLTAQQWAACTGIGAITLLVRAVLRLIPPHPQDRIAGEEQQR